MALSLQKFIEQSGGTKSNLKVVMQPPKPETISQQPSQNIGVAALQGIASSDPTAGLKDMYEAGQAGVGRFRKGFQEVSQATSRPINPQAKGNIALSAKEAISDVGQVAKGALNMAAGGLETVFSPITGLFTSASKVPPIQAGLESINQNIVEPSADVISSSPALQKFMLEYPEADEIVQNLITVAGAIYAPKGLKESTKPNIRPNIRPKVSTPPSPPTSGVTTKVGNVVNTARDVLTPIKEGVETVLQETPEKTYSDYVKAGRESIKDPRNLTPMDYVGEKAQKVYKMVEHDVSEAGTNKRDYTKSIGKTETGNIASEARAGLRQDTPELGFTFKDDGTVRRAPGRELRVPASDIKILKRVDDMLTRISDNPSLQRVDDTIDAIQEMLYKHKATLGAKPISTEVEAIIKRRIGELNSKLKAIGGPEYSALNEEYSTALGIRNALARGLGKDFKSSTSFAKRFFSPTDGGVKKLFSVIKERYGIDLGRDATIAKFVMDSLGDTRQMSLLERESFSKRGILNKAVDYGISKLQDPLGKGQRIVESNARSTPATTNTSSRTIASTVPQKPGVFKRIGKMLGSDLPNKQGGFVKIGKDALEARKPILDKLQSNIDGVIKDIESGSAPLNKVMNSDDVLPILKSYQKMSESQWNKMSSEQFRELSETMKKAGYDVSKTVGKGSPAMGQIAPELEPLAQEARKYKSAEEFVKAKTGNQGIYNDQYKRMIEKNRIDAEPFDFDLMEALGSTPETKGDMVKIYRLTDNGRILPGDNVSIYDVSKYIRPDGGLDPIGAKMGIIPKLTNRPNVKLIEQWIPKKHLYHTPAGTQIYVPDGIKSLTAFYNKVKGKK